MQYCSKNTQKGNYKKNLKTKLIPHHPRAMSPLDPAEEVLFHMYSNWQSSSAIEP